MTCPEDRGLDEPENAQQYESRDLAEVDVAAFARSYAAFLRPCTERRTASAKTSTNSDAPCGTFSGWT